MNDKTNYISGEDNMPKLLIVEDDADIVENLSVLLENEGYSVCHALDVKGALNKLRTENIDLVLSAWAVLLVVVVCTTSVLLFLLFTRTRYQAISDLSVQVDNILHGEYNVNLIPDEEGELAVFSRELSKMTLRLRDQTDRLEKDKRYLSDSLADMSHQLRTPLTSIRI